MPVITGLWTSCQILKVAGCACAGNTETFSSPPKIMDPDMHHSTCVTHMPWCLPVSLIRKRLRHSQRVRNRPFYVSGKRPILQSFAEITVEDWVTSRDVFAVTFKYVQRQLIFLVFESTISIGSCQSKLFDFISISYVVMDTKYQPEIHCITVAYA